VKIHQYAHSPDLSEEFEDMMWWAMEGPADDETKLALRQLNVQTTILRKQVADFFRENPNRTEIPTAIRIYKKAKELEEDLHYMLDNDQHLCMRRIARWQDEIPESDLHRATAYPGKVYEFDNVFVAARFLSLYLHRLVLAEILLQVSSWIEASGACASSTYSQRQEALALAREQISEIIAAIPFFGSWPNSESPSPFGAMTCSFPLFVVGLSTVISRSQKAFLVGRLNHLSSATGLRIPRKFAEELKASTSPTQAHDFIGKL
jgi:hypothetical protein